MRGWPDMAGGPAWSGLGAAQVRGRACVICAGPLVAAGADGQQARVMVGRGSRGAPVFGCPGHCAARAAALGAPLTRGGAE